jgi:hypothetical protein
VHPAWTLCDEDLITSADKGRDYFNSHEMQSQLYDTAENREGNRSAAENP